MQENHIITLKSFKTPLNLSKHL